MRHAIATLLAAVVLVPAPAQDLPGWAGRIRRDHPRLFFNADTFAKVRARALGPEKASITSVGGPGREFQAAGRNWAIDSGDLDPEERAMMGRWRIEVSPDKARKDDLFLHVIRVGDRSLNAIGDVRLIRRNQTAGARIATRGTTWTLTFATTGPLRGHVKATGNITLNRRLTTTVSPQASIVP